MSRPLKRPAADWAQTPERGNNLLLRLMTWISLRLGRRIGRLVLHPIAGYFLLFSPAGRRASRHYLSRVLHRPPGWRDLYLHFFTFAATIHDRLYLIDRRFDLFDIEVHGEATLHRLLADGRGLLLIGAHLGSFEVISALGHQDTPLRIAMLMHQENAQRISAQLAAINPDNMPDIIGLGQLDAMLKVRQRLDAGDVVGMLADRAPATPGPETRLPAQLLGAKVLLPGGPWRMAALLRRPVVFMTGLYLGGNRYAIHFEPLADFSAIGPGQREEAMAAAVARYAALLDRYCRQAPYNWFNFFDFWPPTETSTPPQP